MVELTYSRLSVKQKILEFLIENKTSAFSIKDISRLVKLDYKLTYINVQKLKDAGIIEVEDLSTIKRCSFKDKFNEDVFHVEYIRQKKVIAKKEFKAIYDKIKTINKQFIILLFGSHIKGTATKNSDIDILVIAKEDDSKLISAKLDILPLNIHITPISLDSFISMVKSKEQTVVSECMKKNVILFGIEDYYRVLENAK